MEDFLDQARQGGTGTHDHACVLFVELPVPELTGKHDDRTLEACVGNEEITPLAHNDPGAFVGFASSERRRKSRWRIHEDIGARRPADAIARMFGKRFV